MEIKPVTARDKRNTLDLVVFMRINYLDNLCHLSLTVILKHSQFEDRAVTKLKNGLLHLPVTAINWFKLL